MMQGLVDKKKTVLIIFPLKIDLVLHTQNKEKTS